MGHACACERACLCMCVRACKSACLDVRPHVCGRTCLWAHVCAAVCAEGDLTLPCTPPLLAPQTWSPPLEGWAPGSPMRVSSCSVALC